MRVFLVVLDGVGIGELPDAADYGDVGSATLQHVAEHAGGLTLPALERLGLGNLVHVAGMRALADPSGARARLMERSAGKDSTTGHWEMMGIVLPRAFPTYPNGFPTAMLDAWSAKVGRGWMGNVAASGTEILTRLGAAHERTGDYIVYTSADSVFQVAAHEAVVPVDELYAACRVAREMLTGEHAVGRVIARPFTGTGVLSGAAGSSSSPASAGASGASGASGAGSGGYRRTERRHDFSLAPIEPTVMDRMVEAGQRVVTVGKVDDLFAGRGVSDSIHTRDNDEGQAVLLDLVRDPGEGLVFANLVDFDTLYGHRNDAGGFARALERYDASLAEFLPLLRDDEMLWVTADHGNDPTTASTDHAREYTPLLVAGPRVHAGADLGNRSTFADLGATLADVFSVRAPRFGVSFLKEIRA